MKQMLKWTAAHASLLLRPDQGETIYEKAAVCARDYLNQGRDLTIDVVEVEDRVFDRAHDTGIKSFDALLRKNQGTFITGNVYGDAQFSQYVRGSSETKCNGMEFAPGVLRQADLKVFDGARPGNSGLIRDWLARASNSKDDVIVYGFRNKGKTEAVFGLGNITNWHWYGYLVTDTKHNLLFRYYDAPDHRANRVLDEAEHFVTTLHHKNLTPLVRLKDGHLELLTPEVQKAYDSLPPAVEEVDDQLPHRERGGA